jgi:hypothetical protein
LVFWCQDSGGQIIASNAPNPVPRLQVSLTVAAFHGDLPHSVSTYFSLKSSREHFVLILPNSGCQSLCFHPELLPTPQRWRRAEGWNVTLSSTFIRC